MPSPQVTSDGSLGARVGQDGFAFVDGDALRPLLEQHGSLGDWAEFAASWNELAVDHYLEAVGRHRRRRHAVFCADIDEPLRIEPHQPHYQGLQYNSLQGDIARWFEPIQTHVVHGASLATILRFGRAFFDRVAKSAVAWRIEVHQFRIEARRDQTGHPTPEGVHRDGVDYVLVLLVDRENIARGTTTIHDSARSELGAFTLTHPLDAAFVDDSRVFHGVTAVSPLDPDKPAHRDVLVATFKAAE